MKQVRDEWGTVVNLRQTLSFRIEVEERFDAEPQLRLDLLAAAFEHMHRHPGLIAVLQLHRSFAHACQFIRRQQPHSIHHHKIRHASILAPAFAVA
jgi:hypothetical protein